jgi:hypothetical protein
MSKLLSFIIGIILLSSCSKYIQVFETSSTNTVSENENWVFETDTVKVTYEFWMNKGVMAFTVFNKLDIPIYIDWKNSSFIYNSEK